MTQRQVALSMIIIGVLGLTAAAVLFRSDIRDWYRQRTLEPVPGSVSFNDLTTSPKHDTTPSANQKNSANSETGTATEKTTTTTDGSNTKIESVVELVPEELNLAIPFTSQAPFANWDLPYQEACEEASILMAARFLQNRPITEPADADAAILELVEYNVSTLQQPIDTTAEQTAYFLEEFYELHTELVYDWSWDDVKTALSQGYPVILPAAGRQLGNPYYTAPGPLYHMLVIKGYTPNIVITNDPGTRRGADYQYTYDTLYNANHDWNNGNVAEGAKVIIIVQP